VPSSQVQDAGATDREPAGSLLPEAIAEGVRRLGWLGLVYAVVSIAGPFARLVLSAARGTVDSSDFGIPDLFGLAAVVMGLAVFAVVRRGVLSSKRLLDLGLVFQVVGALGIAVREFWYGLPQTPGGSFSIPAECVWVVVYPLLVPNTPTKILVTSLLAASMGPAALAISVASHGIPLGRPLDAVVYFLTSSYICAVLAYVIARIVHRFSTRLEDAREVGSYTLIERIGAGGMGEVWRAQHRLLVRPAAIKLIRSDMLGESLRAREALVRRFEREARDTAALGSIHTIGVYDFGLTEEGDFYYVMELLEGISLERLVQEFGPVDPGRTVYLLRQVCHSLGEAHARGLVHRDIKPANIFVCRVGPDDDFVKVLDFGLVKHTAAGQTVTMVSMEGTAAGTPSYMAPEIALGRADVDGRADIYSLGCVAYFLLTGQRVFSGDTPVAAALAHVQNAPVPPDARSPFAIPAALDALILDCLAKDPAARPPSAAVVDQRLASAVPRDAWTPEAAHAWWDLHQPVARIGSAAAPVAADGRATGLAKPPSFRPQLDRESMSKPAPGSIEERAGRSSAVRPASPKDGAAPRSASPSASAARGRRLEF
jgi:serine/threonine-protein kinase